MKHKSLGMFLAFGVFAANAADFYVDANSTAETPDGSQVRPYKTIVEAVNAANAKGAETGEATFVYIRALGKDGSGNDIPYVFDDKDDLVVVTASNMTITSWGDEKPLIELAASLGKSVYDATGCDPNAITLGEKIKVDTKKCDSVDLYCEVKNLRFCFYGKNHDSREGQSLGNGGKVIRVNGRHCVIDGCYFFASGTFKSGKSGRGVVGPDNGDTPEGSTSENDRDTVGKSLTVKNCLFENIKNLTVGTICVSNNGNVHNNIFLNCDRVFFAIKQSAGGYFVSNKVVNCSKAFSSKGEGYGETSNAELAYNIFVFANGDVDFFTKAFRGFTGSPKIHHNTVVGARNFINIEDIIASNGNTTTWTPWIFDNLIVLAGEGGVICENTQSLSDSVRTSFKSGSFCSGNVYVGKTFSTGTALGYDLYDLSSGLSVSENVQLEEVPFFIETEDVFSPDYYRLNETRYAWVRTAARGAEGYAAGYVGAVEPVSFKLGFAIDDFSVSAEAFVAGREIIFSAACSHNQGDVYYWWDFDGDGQYDAEGASPICAHVYSCGGIFNPVVKARDVATGETITKEYSASALTIKGSLIYVDSLAPVEGSGSQENPFRSIAAAVKTAVDSSTIFVRGGKDRFYRIAYADDLVVVDKPNVVIKAWGDGGNARIEAVPGLADAIGGRPSVFTISEYASGVAICGMDFIWYGDMGNEAGVGSFSLSSGGYALDIYADSVSVESCSFSQEGEISRNADKCWAVYAHAGQNAPDNGWGENVKVRNCTFTGASGEKRQLQAIHCGVNPEIIGNLYTNCGKIFFPLKGNLCDFMFVSNKLSECFSLEFEGGNWKELQKGTIAYNTFVTTKGDSFIVRNNFGFDGEGSFIHNNTVIGSTNFVHNTSIGMGNFTPWRPKMYNNLIILSNDGILFREDGTTLKDTHSSSFKTDGGATFNNNAYLSSGTISTGTATELEGYDLSKGLAIEKNYVLTQAPRFLSTDLESPDFYRLKSRKGDWAFATATGGYPNYVGAIEPQLMADGFSIVVR